MAGYVVYARVDRKTKTWITKFRGGPPKLTETKLIQNLLDYAMNQPEVVAREILQGEMKSGSAIGLTMERLAWADHAYNRRLWVWAIAAYGELESSTRTSRSKGLERLSLYKRSICYSKIAINIRGEAIERSGRDDLWNDRMSAAIDAAKHALSLHRRIEQMGSDHHPVIYYNNACFFSMMAQFEIERAVFKVATP